MTTKNETQEIIDAVKSVVERRTPPAVVSVTEAARLLGVSKRTAYSLLSEGHLKRAFLPGRKRAYGVARVSIDALLAVKDGGVE